MAGNTDGIVPKTMPEFKPGENAVRLDCSDEGFLYKEILREGTGTTHPHEGAKVYVHYVGKLLDGTQFDSSRDRNEHFSFDLGRGNVIKGWDEGVATMKKGELCILTCSHEFAYGETGSEPKIPPKATLQFEVELFNWECEDLSPEKDHSIDRVQIQKGTSFETPNDGASVTLHYIGRYNGQIFKEDDASFDIGDCLECGLPEGVEIALKNFKKNEKSIITLQPKYAFGDTGKAEYNIPPNAVVEYELHLKQFEKIKESWEMNKDEKLIQAQILKGKGTNLFQKGRYKPAESLYKRVTEYLDNESFLDPVKNTKRDELMLAGLLNRAMCQLKMQQYNDCIDTCDKALTADSKSVKALYRRGESHMALNDWEIALRDFQTIVELDPNNKAAKNQVLIAQTKIKRQQQKEKAIYGGMFQRFAEQDTKKEEANKQPDVFKNGIDEFKKEDFEHKTPTDEEAKRRAVNDELTNVEMLNAN